MLSHPNIVNIYDVSVKDNLKYIVMELVDGITLKNYIQKKGVIPFGEAVRITEQILLALHHAHAKGIVHRDIKPQNIMMLKNGVIKVADFGIAKLPNAETVTMSDKAIGTVFYISPEQASGKPIDRRSDIYSLGVTMYEMVTGKLPFVSDNPVSVAIMQVKNRPKPPRELNPQFPKGLEQIILGAMEKNPDNRFQSASQMLRHLQQIKNNPATVFKIPKSDQGTQTGNPKKSQSLPSNVKKLTPKNRSSRSMFPIIGGVASAFLIVCIVSFIVLWNKLGSAVDNDEVKQITIPRLVSKEYTDNLMKQLEATGYYKVNAVLEPSSLPKHAIIAQDPLPDEKRKVVPNDSDQMCELTLTISMGPQKIVLPDFSYNEKRYVETELRNNYGIKFVVDSVPHEYVPGGYVIETVFENGESTVGKEVDVFNDTITVRVSTGQSVEETAVPNFVGMTEQEAKDALKKAHLGLGTVTEKYSDKVEAGRIIEQTPEFDSSSEANNTVSKGTRVDLVISLGPRNQTAGNAAN